MKASCAISEFMTKTPHTIGEGIPLSEALKMMNEYKIRHLPVLSSAKVVGVLSDRDVRLALSVHPSASDLKVGDIMTESVYAVLPETPLREVAYEMSKNRYGCAVVKNAEDRAVGIFSAVDGLKVLADTLK